MRKSELDGDFQFQSTLPVRGATFASSHSLTFGYISIHAPRAGSDYATHSVRRTVLITIHAPRAGSDVSKVYGSVFSLISIHAPRAGSDRGRRPWAWVFHIFQSTLPVRGATHAACAFYCANNAISIHAPRAGSDRYAVHLSRTRTYFNPRSPCGERHCGLIINYCGSDFNPRSPCGERPTA